MKSIALILKIIGYVCFFIAIIVIIVAIIGNITAIPKGLSFYNYARQVFLGITDPFNPFKMLNFIANIVLLLPCIIFISLSKWAESRIGK